MKLNKHIRFREEKDYILLCKVDTLQYFQLDKKFLNVLNKLNQITHLEDLYKLYKNRKELHSFIGDLVSIGALETNEKDTTRI